MSSPLILACNNDNGTVVGFSVFQEGLQNADDAGATKFALMLDLRDHPTDDLREAGLARAQCEAMLLFDNGGFDDKDWTSFQNLHKSEKRKSPLTTGKSMSYAPCFSSHSCLILSRSGVHIGCFFMRITPRPGIPYMRKTA